MDTQERNTYIQFYSRKEANGFLSSLAQITYQSAFFMALAPALLGYMTGRGYSYLSTPSEDEIKAMEADALTNETNILTDRLKTLPSRKKSKKTSDVAWKGGFR